MTSVTAEPPTLLICIHSESPSCKVLQENGRFCANVLKAEHADLSASFAGQLPFNETDTFAGPAWSNSALGS
ncbi:UNVERIFIED_CONTAM: hypothetical protein GTU68_026287, partial [Idotea baltica]|nr:hypothetical protein [Idotea baltica]